MKTQSPTEFIRSMLTPEQRAEGHRRCQEYFDDYTIKLEAKHERQRRQTVAQNELESTGENQC